jgi:hypothetical protein
MSTGQRLAVLAAVIVVAIGGLVIARGGGDDDNESTTTSAATSTSTGTRTTTTEQSTTEDSNTGGDTTTSSTTKTPVVKPVPTHTITVKGGKPVGGVQRIKVKKGDIVRLIIESDVADEVHVHGYDLQTNTRPGRKVGMEFKATSDGNYEIELENRKVQIAQLTVEP